MMDSRAVLVLAVAMLCVMSCQARSVDQTRGNVLKRLLDLLNVKKSDEEVLGCSCVDWDNYDFGDYSEWENYDFSEWENYSPSEWENYSPSEWANYVASEWENYSPSEWENWQASEWENYSPSEWANYVYEYEGEVFTCADGTEVPADWQNDGWNDCGDCSDETSDVCASECAAYEPEYESDAYFATCYDDYESEYDFSPEESWSPHPEGSGLPLPPLPEGSGLFSPPEGSPPPEGSGLPPPVKKMLQQVTAIKRKNEAMKKRTGLFKRITHEKKKVVTGRMKKARAMHNQKKALKNK